VDLISGKADARSIKDLAVAGGMKTLRDDGLLKVQMGMTALEEVLRVTQKDNADI
jgi:type IV pilus assembly protein PilB